MRSENEKARKRYIRWIIALSVILVVAVMVLVFFNTAPGVAAAQAVKKNVTKFIETLFPPKDIPVNIEGETENSQQQAGGQEPEVNDDGTVAAPGFAIYYDPEWYAMTEENGVTYIRFDMGDAELPPCEMEIKHISALAPDAAATVTRAQMLSNWETVSEPEAMEGKDGVEFSFSAGMSWDSVCGRVYFISDGRDGAFQITARYFVEAAEGHGSRFYQMVQTFEVIDP